MVLYGALHGGCSFISHIHRYIQGGTCSEMLSDWLCECASKTIKGYNKEHKNIKKLKHKKQ